MYIGILAGGVGSRLWPSSRSSLPKQFSDLTGAGRTLIQSTVERVAELAGEDEIYVITGTRYRSLVAEQLENLPPANIIVEPHGRNTAPAIGLACIHVYHRDPNGIIALLHADHVIQDRRAYLDVLRQAERAAREGHLVVLGIEPDQPHTGYGYIKRSPQPLPVSGELPVYPVEQFLEKPDLITAERFLAEGGYFWNAGNFICRVDRLLAEFERQMPELHAGLMRIAAALGTPDADGVLETVWPTLPSVSIDHGVMEGAGDVAVVPLGAGWNDVGSWDALEAVLQPGADGNILVRGDTLILESRGNIVSGGRRLLALVGVENLVVVDVDDALLIGDKAQMQLVKRVVEELRAADRADLL